MKRHTHRGGTPLKLSIEQHRELIRRKEAGEGVASLAVRYGIFPHTVYDYLRRDPATRQDAQQVAAARAEAL